MNKIYTSFEQSKKLAEILPIEGADMCWQYQKDRWVGEPVYKNFPQFECATDKRDIPCWSIAALLQILPIKTYIEIDNVCCTLDISRDTLGKWFVCYHNRSYGSSLVTCSSKELVNACYETIIRLYELNLL